MFENIFYIAIAGLFISVVVVVAQEGLISEQGINNFQENYAKVEEFNKNRNKKDEPYETKLNEFSAMSHEEFKSKYLSKNLISQTNNRVLDDKQPTLQSEYKDLPSHFDWREYGFVSTPRHQGSCGTCWSFANVGAMETIWASKYGELIEMSEQDLNDCSKKGPYKNWGCNGGYPSNGFYHIVKVGLVSRKVCPYSAKDLTCKKDLKSQRFKARGYRNIPYGNEDYMKKVIATWGPITVAIDSSEWGFAYYSKGIYISKKCGKHVSNHAVLVVGYGTDEQGIDYWIVKNSWGPSWGEGGYIRMGRNKDNMCGIATMASFAYM